jgi:hypothetical protein
MNPPPDMSDETAAFDAGMADGLDPQPTGAEFGADGQGVTHSSSTWHHRICTTCGNSFRRNDLVIRDATTGRVQHLDPALRCAATDADPAASWDERAESEASAFAAGLLETWPPRNGVPVTRLSRYAWQVSRPGSTRPPLCQGCAHTVRAGETVVICPCNPHDPGECRTAIHRDPGMGLPCWEQTRPEGYVEVCPWRLVRVPPR